MVTKKTTKKGAVKKKTVKKEAKKQLITKESVIGDVAEKYPKAVEVMFKYGLHCIGCHVSPFETIEQGSLAHGMSEKDIAKMVDEMNAKV